jgi:hypothetical protein
VAALCVILVLACIAAPLNQARIGTSVSLHKHVVFGAWFGCFLAGYAVTRILRVRVLIAACALAALVLLGAVNAMTAQTFYGNWPTENMAFIAALKPYVHSGDDRYLLSGYDDIPAYYVGSVSSVQWKEAGDYSYTDPQTGQVLVNGPAFADAIRHQVFSLIILNFQGGVPGEPANDYAIAADIAKYGGYKIVGHLPPDDSASRNYYTVWRVTGGSLRVTAT